MAEINAGQLADIWSGWSPPGAWHAKIGCVADWWTQICQFGVATAGPDASVDVRGEMRSAVCRPVCSAGRGEWCRLVI
ncbi:MAG: hypothetical protein ACRDNF_24495, partial [Streptosporangiaceae bacterium]